MAIQDGKVFIVNRISHAQLDPEARIKDRLFVAIMEQKRRLCGIWPPRNYSNRIYMHIHVPCIITHLFVFLGGCYRFRSVGAYFPAVYIFFRNIFMANILSSHCGSWDNLIEKESERYGGGRGGDGWKASGRTRFVTLTSQSKYMHFKCIKLLCALYEFLFCVSFVRQLFALNVHKSIAEHITYSTQ